MELNLTVQPPSSQAVDVDIKVDGTRPISDVVEALVKATGVPSALSGQMSLYIPSRDLWLNSDMEVEKANLKIGEVVVLGRNASEKDSSSSSATIGDVAEKNRLARSSKKSMGLSSFELNIASGKQNGERLSLYKTSLVVVDHMGNTRVLEQSVNMRANFGEFDKEPKKHKAANPRSIVGKVDRQFEGITPIDVTAFLVEADGKIFVEAIYGDAYIEVRKIPTRTQIDEHAMIVAGGVQFQIRPRIVEETLSVSNRGIVGINRPPRDMRPPTEKTITIEAPPRPAQKARFSPMVMVIPIVMGVSMWKFMPGHSKMYLMMSLFSPAMMISQFFENKRNGKNEFKAAKKKYEADIGEAVTNLRTGRREELAIRRVVWPDAADCISRVVDSRHDLWDRRRDDIDFLSYRVGVGDQVALVSATIEPGGSEDLRDFGEKKLRRSDPIHLSPLVVSLSSHGALGLVGERKNSMDVLHWLILQTITLHSHRDLSICAALPNTFATEFEYMKWVPHVRYGGAEIDEPTFAFGEEKSVVLFQKIRALIDSRMASKSSFSNDQIKPASVVFLVDESIVRDRTSIDTILKVGPSVNVYTIFMASQFRDLPGECKAIIDVGEPTPTGNDVSIAFPGTGQSPTIFTRESVDVEKLNYVAQLIAPMRDVTASVSGGGGGSLPKNVRLLDILDMPKPTPENVITRWQNSPESLQAILGVTIDGLMKIDLRLDGPHGLIAGTTGSGKSELLQTFVASIATNYSPSKVNFLFVDYKGGTAFAECSQIPHSVGMVTDLDEYLAQRVLISLNAELKRREALLREFSCKDLITFEKRFPNECPPSLIIVIDEFAALAREVPDFVEGVVDIAQRGRSLGLHLILATQRPSGVVNDNIRANTNLRIALRIADGADSTDVIGTDEAARIPRSVPGRAFVRMGPSDLTAFQSGYGGDFTVELGNRNADGEEEDENSDSQTGPISRTPLVVEPFTLLGLLEVDDNDDIDLYVMEKEDIDDSLATTDLSYLCSVISQAAFQMNLPKPRQPWKEPLTKLLPLSEAGDMSLLNEHDKDRRFIMGLLDLPATQAQEMIAHDFEDDGNLFIYGTSSAGKTTALRTIAMSLAVSAPPKDLIIYGLDCASGGLDSLKELPHCVAVYGTRDAEGVGHFLGKMGNEIEIRKELLRANGTSTLGEYRNKLRNNGVENTLPRIVILLDSFAGFASAFDKIEYGAWIDQVQRLIADGRPLGIHVVITADRRGAIPFNMAGLVETKLVLKMSDPDELTSLGVAHKMAKEIKLSPGRAIFKGTNELQIPIVSHNPEGAAQVAQISKIAEYLKSVYPDAGVVKATPLPESISLAALPMDVRDKFVSLGVMVSEQGLIAASVDFNRNHFFVSGPRGTGKSHVLASLLRGVEAKRDGSISFVFTPRPNFISTIDGLHNVAVGITACENQIEEIIKNLSSVQEEVPDIYLFIDDCDDLAEGIFAQQIGILMGVLKQKVHVITTGDPSMYLRAYTGWLSEVKKPKSGLLLRPDHQMDGELTGVKLKVLPGQTFPPGRGYLCLDRQAVLIQAGI